MSGLDHSTQTRDDGVHTIIAKGYANEAARLAVTGWVSDDVGKVAVDLDTNTLNWLVDHDPITWATFDAGVAAQLNKVEIDCRKGSVGTLAVGTAVYANGWNIAGAYATCEAAKADSATTLPVVGIVSVEATDSTTGKVMVVGVLGGLDTSSFTAQQPIYVSHTTAGEFTATPPPGPYAVQPIGAILSSDVSDGRIGVNIQDFRAIEYTTAPLAPGTAAAGTANTSSAHDHVHPSELVDQANVLFVGKHGNDSNDGKTIEAAFLTFGAALAEALSQTPSSFNPFNIQCVDAGGYIEDITIYSYCVVTAPAASLLGEIILQDYAGGEFLQIRVGAGETAVSKTSGTETSSIKASGIDATGSGNAIKNDGTDSIIIAELDYINVEDGDAVHDNSSGSGHIHAHVADIYISGDGKGLVTAGGAGKIYGVVDEIEDVGAGTTTAIDVQTGTVRCRVSRIEADTAWSVASGATLEAFIGSYTGSTTETGTVEVTVAGDAGAELSSTAPVNVTKATASAGTATDASRQDHKHDVTTAAAGAATPGDSASEGTATSLARSDHQHSLPAYGTGAGTFCEGNDSRLSDSRTPTAHQASHNSGGSDSLKLDDLAAPDDNTDLNATTSAHGLLLKLGGGTTNYLRADGTWNQPPGTASSVFGDGFVQASSESESTTTSTTFQQKVRLTSGTLVSSAVYRIGYSFEFNHNSGSTSTKHRVQINDTTTILEQLVEPQDTSNYHAVAGFYYYTGAGAAINIDLDYCVATGGTSAIRRARLEIWRVS